jgi:hypothetical protein
VTGLLGLLGLFGLSWVTTWWPERAAGAVLAWAWRANPPIVTGIYTATALALAAVLLAARYRRSGPVRWSRSVAAPVAPPVFEPPPATRAPAVDEDADAELEAWMAARRGAAELTAPNVERLDRHRDRPATPARRRRRAA